MSESERKSHIPDETLAALTENKLKKLEIERNELSHQLFETAVDSNATFSEQEKLAQQIENRDAALDKLNVYRAGMLDDCKPEGA